MPLPGALFFPTKDIEAEWRSERIDAWLRVVLIEAHRVYSELGGRMSILTLLDGDHASSRYGRGATLSILNLPGVRSTEPARKFRYPVWVCSRLNLCFPYPGQPETATCENGHIRIETPSGGYHQIDLPVSEWIDWGATGTRILRPRKIKV